MEYYLCRAMEVCRLNEEELDKLHRYEATERVMKEFDPRTGTYAAIETKQKRTLMPYEIQDMFTKGSLKEKYHIPEDDVAQSVHNQRLRSEFRRENLIPLGGDISSSDIEKVHTFDESVRHASDQIKINLDYQGGENKERFRNKLR